MKANSIPILLTSSVIAHDTSVKLTDTEKRIAFALESVREWLAIDSSLQIILCDGSGFDFTPLITKKFPNSKTECIFFENNKDMVSKYGRGFGEGEIVKYALARSESISKAGCFAKCTSKLWVKNYLKCLSAWNGNLLFKGVFVNTFSLFRPIKLKYIDTRFYIASISAYEEFFINSHLNIKKDIGHGLEECFLESIQKNKIEACLLNEPPIICGVGGGTGVSYKTSFKRTIKEKLKIRLARRNKNFYHLFSKR
ncbi:hypothetical protein [Rhodoferax sp. U11-2br]|uniref:hypothetical protein n=1 Tax=Rhodoferax sp. U11-2br TaxID=2838878 RepID=UPI001BEBF5C8|nr:hypothetical protein [Rhodoferax sp. U11-2br]MBT3065252.1 hypothetical protein [Rhodoferax sp. U11-2br]